MKKILCICLSSTLQRTISFSNLSLAKVNRSEYYRQDASGKAINSARVLEQLEEGCVQALCPVGEENADVFLKLAQRDNIPLAYVSIPGQIRECWTLLDRAKCTTTELVVSEPSLSGDDLKKVQSAEIKLLKYLTDFLPEVDAVLLAGSRPACWSDDLYSAICGIVKDNGKIFLADYIGDDLLRSLKSLDSIGDGGEKHNGGRAVPDIIKINDEEFCKTFSLSFPINDDDLKGAVCRKSKELGNKIVITRGVKSTFAGDAGEFFECPSESVKVVNTTACGDSFNAGFLYEFVNSGDFKKALERGTWCASRNAEVEIPGSIK